LQIGKAIIYWAIIYWAIIYWAIIYWAIIYWAIIYWAIIYWTIINWAITYRAIMSAPTLPKLLLTQSRLYKFNDVWWNMMCLQVSTRCMRELW
jgi:hypothetical protein